MSLAHVEVARNIKNAVENKAGSVFKTPSTAQLMCCPAGWRDFASDGLLVLNPINQ
jgi:hypothetical protein